MRGASNPLPFIQKLYTSSETGIDPSAPMASSFPRGSHGAKAWPSVPGNRFLGVFDGKRTDTPCKGVSKTSIFGNSTGTASGSQGLNNSKFTSGHYKFRSD